ncbi:MAG: hypothetical protein LLG37_02740 [Spirochaetia bacterium]|nr:hypothetical protein [Spirochaetia bacterium]
MKKFSVLLIELLFVFSMCALPLMAAGNEELSDIKASDDMPVEADPSGIDEPGMPNVPDYLEYIGVVNLWVGYSTLSMNSVNAFIDDINDDADTLFDMETSNMDKAYVLGLDLGLLVFKGFPLSIGARVEYVGGFQASIKGTNSFLGLLPDVTRTLDALLVPIMAGATYNLNIKGMPIDLAADAYIGYALAKATLTQDWTTDETANLSGGGFAMDFGIKANYRVSKPLSIGLHIGYRIANIEQMTADEEANNVFGLDKGEVLKNVYDSDSVIAFDFTGFTFGINANMKY